MWRRGHGEVERHRKVGTAAGGHLLQLLIGRREVGAAERGAEAGVVEGHLGKG